MHPIRARTYSRATIGCLSRTKGSSELRISYMECEEKEGLKPSFFVSFVLAVPLLVPEIASLSRHVEG